MSIELHIVFE